MDRRSVLRALVGMVTALQASVVAGAASSLPGGQDVAAADKRHDNLHEVVDWLLASLTDRWNASDSEGYAAYYHPDADFVDVLGRLSRGRDAIARIHRQNFDTIHLGSRIRLDPLSAQILCDNVALVHVKGAISVPAGPLAGDSTSTQTLVLEQRDGEWHIRSFHNTFVREMAGVPAVDD